jgi:two-component system nitrogen regulation response regulator GlnG/two-component system response regulator HydG
MTRSKSEAAYEPTPDRVTAQIGADLRVGSVDEVPALVVAWSLREPERVGEVTLFEDFTPRVIGRGGPRADDGAPRAAFSRQRPGGIERRPALDGASLSRRHVRLTPDTDGIAIERLSKGTVVIDGELSDAGFISPGGTLMLSNELVLVCERRPSRLIAGAMPAGTAFPFGGTDPAGLTGETPAAWRLRDQARFVAGAGSPLLIYGPSGAGKEVVARAVHHASAWKDRPLVMLGGATLTRAELEQVQARTDGPFVVIDELTEVPAEMQPHLLRTINHTLGLPLPRPRILATSAASMSVAAENVRADLLSRFILSLRVPSLDERRADIPLLIRAILRDIATQQPEVAHRFFSALPGAESEGGHPLGEPRLTPRLLDLLVRHRWHANVRELTSLLWSSMTTAVTPFLDATAEVMAQLRDTNETYNDPNALDARTVRQALESSDGRVVAAARMLGLKNRWVLYRLMEKLDIRA